MFGKAPSFDAYMTGSDQVWNCKFTKGDTNFLLKFAPKDSPRLSYGASFASPSIPKEYEHIFKEELPKYSSILVREHSGVDIVKNLIGKNAEVVCDPTLLLTKTDYHVLATKSKLFIPEPFILVYILDYMYNPYPKVYDIIRKVKKELGLKVVYIGTDAPDPMDNNYSYVGGADWTIGVSLVDGEYFFCDNYIFSWDCFCDDISQTFVFCSASYGKRRWKNADVA